MIKYILFVFIFSIMIGYSQTIIYPKLADEIKFLSKQFNKISKERKKQINEIATYIANRLNSNQSVDLIFICTHNSRRSHIAQLWSIASTCYYGLSKINCFSGGTESTAFNHRSIKALKKVGFVIEQIEEGTNPKFKCKIGDKFPEIICFSKKYDDPSNPQKNFAAIMVCSDADQNCPYIPSADNRFSLNYEDPKRYDNTLNEEKEYDKTVRLIGTEIVYLFKLVKEKIKA